jgi:hypothetical protein
MDEIQRRMGVGPPSTAAPFAVVLERTQQARSSSSVDGVSAGRAPAGLEAYGNGRIPQAALAPIALGQHRLWAPAADSFRQMAASAAAAGVRLDITGSYRSYDEQVAVARSKGLYSQGGLAAQPGTSTHGWGLSVDVDATPKALAWLRQHGREFGFVEDVPREPWHWTYRTPG